MAVSCRIDRLQVTRFPHLPSQADSRRASLVALVGDNGAGKTNLLEAVSLLAQGRGLRRADLADMARQGGGGGFAVAFEAEGALGAVPSRHRADCRASRGARRGSTGRLPPRRRISPTICA
jgi:recombinational DNA repair ATPase RecF